MKSLTKTVGKTHMGVVGSIKEKGETLYMLIYNWLKIVKFMSTDYANFKTHYQNEHKRQVINS